MHSVRFGLVPDQAGRCFPLKLSPQSIIFALVILTLSLALDPTRFQLLGIATQPAQAADISYVYDELGRLRAVTDPVTDTAVYNYDAVGNLLSISRQLSSTVSIIEFVPKSGPAGTTVTISGTGFSSLPTENTVTFNGVQATVTSSTSTQVLTTVPAGATTGLIGIITPSGSATSSQAFTVTDSTSAPTVTGFTPSIANIGTPVTVTGTNFETAPAGNTLRFNNTFALVSSATTTTLNTTVPLSSGSGRISVTTPRGRGVSAADFFIPPSPYTPADVERTARMAIGGPSLTVPINGANKIALIVFDGTVGQRISLQVSGSTFPFPGGFAPAATLTIYRPNGTQFVQTSWTSSTGFLDVQTLPTTGTYTMLLDPWEANTGEATLTLNNVPPDNQGTITPGGSAVDISTTVPGQNVSLTFSGTQNQIISLLLTNSTYPNPGGFASSVTLTIYKPDGSQLVQAGLPSPTGFVDRQVLPVTGTYTIHIDPWSINTGQATVTLYNVPPDDQGTITPGGPSVNISTTVPGQNVRLTFAGTTNQRIDLQVTNSTFPNPGGFSNAGIWYILKPDQSILAQVAIFGSSASIGIQTLPVDGTYTVFFDATGTGTGQATVQVGNF